MDQRIPFIARRLQALLLFSFAFLQSRQSKLAHSLCAVAGAEVRRPFTISFLQGFGSWGMRAPASLGVQSYRGHDGVYLISAEEGFTKRVSAAHIVSGREGWKIRLRDYATIPTIGSQNWSGQDATAATTATTIVTAHGHPGLHCCCLCWLGSQSCCSCLPEPLMINSV